MTDKHEGKATMAAKRTAKALEGARLQTEQWLGDFLRLVEWHDPDRALSAMIGALHALRDSLVAEEAVYLGSCLPALLRGFYYEGWHPNGLLKSREAFFRRIEDATNRDPAVEPESVARGLFRLLASHMPQAELENAKARTPEELYGFWPT